MATQIETANQVEELASILKNPRRTRVACVVSIGQAEEQPGFDLAAIEEDAGEVCDFYVIKTGDLTRELMGLLPDNTHVYGGAARAYSADFASSSNASQLRYPIPPVQLAKATANLLRDIWGFANSAGLIARPAPNLKPEKVKVSQIYGGDVALLKRANGDFISLRAEALFPGISLNQVLTVGQELEGVYDPTNKAFALPTQNPTIDELVAHFGINSVTLGLVRETTRKSAVVALHPNLTFEVLKKEITGNELDVVSDYLRIGQVYPFRLYRNPQGHIRLRCDDIEDDEELIPAVALIPGGLPWLEEGIGVVGEEPTEAPIEVVIEEMAMQSEAEVEAMVRAAVEEALAKQAAEFASATPKPNDSRAVNRELAQNDFVITAMRGRILAEQARTQKAYDDAQAVAAELNEVSREFAALQELSREQGAELSRLKKDKRAAGQRLERDPWTSRAQFESDTDWLREEVRRHWIDTYKPADRKQFNLEKNTWSFGKHFFDEFNEQKLDATKLRKVIRTIVELVSNRNAGPRATESHPLTDNFKGQIRRELAGQEGGAMRMYVEENTPGAMRLHYWKLDAGGYELDGVEIHDTFKMRS
jgi:hypothetical protein